MNNDKAIHPMQLIKSIPAEKLADLHMDIVAGEMTLPEVAEHIVKYCKKYWKESGELNEPESQGYMTTIMMAVMGLLAQMIKDIVERGE